MKNKSSILRLGAGIALTILTIVSGIASIFSWLGVNIPKSIGFGIIALLAAGLLIWMLFTYVLSLKKIILKRDSELQRLQLSSNNVEIISNINEIPNKFNLNARNIHIIGSGTETYYNLLSVMLRKDIIKRGINIHILFRLGSNGKRIGKLLQYNHKWIELSKKYDLHIKFYPMADFTFNMRGIVFDESEAFIGFYHRINEETYGGEEEIIHTKNDTSVGSYLIKHFMDRFVNIDIYDSIEKAIIENGLYENETVNNNLSDKKAYSKNELKKAKLGYKQ